MNRNPPSGVCALFPHSPSAQYSLSDPVDTWLMRRRLPSRYTNSSWRALSTSTRVASPFGTSGETAGGSASAACTSGPTLPSGAMPASFWKPCTAYIVAVPNAPSAGPGSKCSSVRRRCTAATSSPCSPRSRTPSVAATAVVVVVSGAAVVVVGGAVVVVVRSIVVVVVDAGAADWSPDATSVNPYAAPLTASTVAITARAGQRGVWNRLGMRLVGKDAR